MFQDNLISLRKLHGFSQDELAEKIGVTRQTLSKYETGESLPDIERCKRLADIFGVSMDDLVNYEKTDRENLGLEVPPKGKHVFGIQIIRRPERLCIIKRGKCAEDYFPYCNEVSCDVWGILMSMKSLCGEPVSM